jgi:ATP-binding cassette subfamily F protein 3
MLIQALNDYEGAVILISHDRHLVEACVDRLWMVKDQTVAPYDGDLETYRNELLAARGNKLKKDKSDNGNGIASKKEQRQLAAQKRAELAPLRKRLKQFEKQIETLHERIETIDLALGDPDLYTKDPTKANDLVLERGQLAKTLESTEEDWLHASESYEKAGG